MRRLRTAWLALVALLALPPQVGSQDTAGGNLSAVTRRGMLVLGGWAIGNIVVGTSAAFVAEDPAWQSFWATTAGWNVVNLGLAAGGLLSPTRPVPADDLSAAHHRLEKILLFNAGLDVGYMALGAWAWDRGSSGSGLGNLEPDQLAGLGQAVLIQGAFLLVFDIVLARAVAADRKR